MTLVEKAREALHALTFEEKAKLFREFKAACVCGLLTASPSKVLFGATVGAVVGALMWPTDKHPVIIQGVP